MNAAEATLAKQAGLWLCGSVNIGIISKRVFWKNRKLAQHAYEEGHKVGWDEARILDIDSHRKYRKYKEAAHMASSIDPISQPSLDISPIWIPIISNEVYSSQRSI
jgi:hypothetical protein